MLRDNSTLRREARASLKGRWTIPLLISCAYAFIAVLSAQIPFIIGVLFICQPVSYGVIITFLKHSRGEEYNFESMFMGFRNYTDVLTTMALVYLYSGLWGLLLIVPGVIKSYSYAMTPYILYDRGLTNNEAIEESMRMMEGHKMRLFCLDLFYVMLTLLLLLTIFGVFWILPKWYIARANFYNDLKAQNE